MRFVLDGRDWRGGIGRFARETTPFLPPHTTVQSRLRPTHPLAPLDLAMKLRTATAPFFSHGYLPPARSPVPAIVTFHDLMYLPGHTVQSPLRARYLSAIRPLLRRCAAVATMSDAARDQVRAWLGDGTRVVAVGGGVSPAYSPGDAPRDTAPPVVLYVGSRAPNKNIAGVLRGFARSRHAATLAVTGHREDWASPLAQAGVDLDSRIDYLGPVAEQSLPDLYRRATVLLMPSTEEGYGLPALEAMATGVPVVYGRDAAMTEVVADAGESVDPLDHAAIGAAIDSIITDPGRAQSLAAIGRQRAAERRWPDVARRITELLESV